MAVLTIRNVPEEIRSRLRLRAAKAGRSMEAEVRAILAGVCTSNDEVKSASSLQEWVDRIYGKRKPRRVVESLIAERRKEAAAE
jgi:plasmid stability protein